MKNISILLFIALVVFSGGCGQKGPLYLPGQTPPIKVPCQDEIASPSKAL